jgi:hypothetical protein
LRCHYLSIRLYLAFINAGYFCINLYTWRVFNESMENFGELLVTKDR